MMEFRVGDVVRAESIFRARGLDPAAVHDTLLAPVEEVDAPPLIAALAAEGIEIYHARQRVQTLEDMFLETTGGESVD
jgi:hypothetical protein